MKDYSNAPFWALSGLGYGKGFSVEEAVLNHDTIVNRDWGKRLSVPVGEIPLTVWEPPADITGFFSDGSIHWTRDDKSHELADGLTQIRAVRNPAEHWLEWAKGEGLEVPVL